jgi:hypothetical protein
LGFKKLRRFYAKNERGELEPIITEIDKLQPNEAVKLITEGSKGERLEMGEPEEIREERIKGDAGAPIQVQAAVNVDNSATIRAIKEALINAPPGKRGTILEFFQSITGGDQACP